MTEENRRILETFGFQLPLPSVQLMLALQADVGFVGQPKSSPAILMLCRKPESALAF